MKTILYIGFLGLTACGSVDKEAATENRNYVESRLGFYYPADKGFTLNKWIREPENIRTVHETFKKYGYNKIFPDRDLTSAPCMIWSYIDKPCVDIIDSLVLTYPHSSTSPKYYREFWARRKTEGNDTTVFAVLKELKQVLVEKTSVDFNDDLTNDTIYNLLRIKYDVPVADRDARDNFDYLVNIGLHLSAYNMLYEWGAYDNVNWNREELETKLEKDTLSALIEPIIEDNTK